MKINEVIKTKLPAYNEFISSIGEWKKVIETGKYDPNKTAGSFCVDCMVWEEIPPNTIPDMIGGMFKINTCRLKTLKGGPSFVGRDYDCSNNNLETLEGTPNVIYGSFKALNNNIRTLEGCPSEFHNYVELHKNKLTSLKNIHKQIKFIKHSLYVSENPITSNILGVLLIKDLNIVKGDNTPFKIVDKYLTGTRDVLECQEELIAAGYKEYAKL